MSGPYNKRQRPQPCGCYYPDITAERDDPRKGVRILFCMTHGLVEIPLGNVSKPHLKPYPRPDEAWRESERKRLRSEK